MTTFSIICSISYHCLLSYPRSYSHISLRPVALQSLDSVALQLPLPVLVTQSCPTLRDSMDSVHGILQARILERVAISFSRGSSWSRDRTQVSHIAGRSFPIWATREAQWWLSKDQLSPTGQMVLHDINSMRPEWFWFWTYTANLVMTKIPLHRHLKMEIIYFFPGQDSRALKRNTHEFMRIPGHGVGPRWWNNAH